jgi:hypothetical protein
MNPFRKEAIMDKNQLIEQQMDDFVKLFHSIPKTISFNSAHWHGEKGSLHGLIHNPEHRLIMEPGEMAKTIDNFKRKIVLLGTQFGIIAIYPTQVQPSRGAIPTLSYCTTQSFVDATAARFPTALLQSAKLVDREHFPFLNPEQLFKLVTEMATYCEDRFIYVGDGLPKPKPVKKFKHRASAKPQPKSAAQKPQAKAKQHPPKPQRPAQAPKPAEAPVRTTAVTVEIAHLPEELHPALAA